MSSIGFEPAISGISNRQFLIENTTQRPDRPAVAEKWKPQRLLEHAVVRLQQWRIRHIANKTRHQKNGRVTWSE